MVVLAVELISVSGIDQGSADPTFLNTASSAAEYRKPFRSLSYSFRRFFRLLSTRSSFTSPTGLDFCFDLTWPCPIEGSAPRKDSNAPLRRAAGEKRSVEEDSEALACRLRTERVPSDIPAAICVSSGFANKVNQRRKCS